MVLGYVADPLRSAQIFDPPELSPVRRLTAQRRSHIRALSINYHLQQRVDWSWWGESPRAQDWIARLEDEGEWVGGVEVIRAGIFGEPYNLADAVDELDGMGGTLAHIALQVMEHSCQPHPQIIARGSGGDNADNMLILDEVMTDRAWTGLGVEAMLVGTVLQRLVNNTLFVVTEPVPWFVKGKARQAASPGAHLFCESLGFVKYKTASGFTGLSLGF